MMLYLIGGDNLYLSVQRLEEIKNEFIDRYGGEIQIFNVDEIKDFNEIISDADCLSLFSKDKLIIIKRLLSSKAEVIDNIYDYMNSHKNMNFVFWEDKSFDKRKKFYKLVKKRGVVEEFKKLQYSRLKIWLGKLLSKKVKYDKDCIDRLIMKIGDDQMQLSYTVNNLADLIKTEKRDELLVRDIDRFVEKTAEENIWEFIDAVSECDKAKAMKIIERLLREKQDFVMIVGMIARQFRILSMIKYLVNLGKGQSEITRILKLHPFVVKKSMRHSYNFTLKQLRKLYQKLFKTDLVVKEGKFEEKLALDLLIVVI